MKWSVADTADLLDTGEVEHVTDTLSYRIVDLLDTGEVENVTDNPPQLQAALIRRVH
jgi:hypothetical protein